MTEPASGYWICLPEPFTVHENLPMSFINRYSHSSVRLPLATCCELSMDASIISSSSFRDIANLHNLAGPQYASACLIVIVIWVVRRKLTNVTNLRCVCLPLQPFDIGDNYCGENDMNHPIHGTEPVTREAVLTWTGAVVTSLAVTVTDSHTVAFIGTHAGELKKVGVVLTFILFYFIDIIIYLHEHTLNVK